MVSPLLSLYWLPGEDGAVVLESLVVGERQRSLAPRKLIGRTGYHHSKGSLARDYTLQTTLASNSETGLHCLAVFLVLMEDLWAHKGHLH